MGLLLLKKSLGNFSFNLLIAGEVFPLEILSQLEIEIVSVMLVVDRRRGLESVKMGLEIEI